MSTKYIEDIGGSAAILGVILLAMNDHKNDASDDVTPLVVTTLTLDHAREVEIVNLELNKSLGFIVLGRDVKTDNTIEITLPFGTTARARAVIIDTSPNPIEDA